MPLPLTTLPDDVLRARLRRAARERMDSTSQSRRAVAGQACLEVIAELQRRRVPLWRAPDASRSCAATTDAATWDGRAAVLGRGLAGVVA